MTPFGLHCERWKNGCGSPQCEGATRVVIARGNIPCDVLFVGEAPGVSEDVRGIPFDGPAGALLDKIVARAFEGREVRMAFTNLVGCLPHNESGKIEPEKDQIKSCQPRLREFIKVVQPRMVVAVGSLADKHLSSATDDGVTFYAGGKVDGPTTIRRWTSIVHPAAILRGVPAQKSMMVTRSVVTLANALAELDLEHGE